MGSKSSIQIREIIEDYIGQVKQALDSLNRTQVEQAVEVLLDTYRKNKKVFVMGNGGSAANASHFACDMSKQTLERAYEGREKRFKVYSLTDNAALITAYANDLSFEDIFLQQLRNLVEKGDAVIILSGSGNSKNILPAARYAKKRRAVTIAITGFRTGGKLGKLADYQIQVKSRNYGPYEDIQLVLNHIITICLSKLKNHK